MNGVTLRTILRDAVVDEVEARRLAGGARTQKDMAQLKSMLAGESVHVPAGQGAPVQPDPGPVQLSGDAKKVLETRLAQLQRFNGPTPAESFAKSARSVDDLKAFWGADPVAAASWLSQVIADTWQAPKGAAELADALARMNDVELMNLISPNRFPGLVLCLAQTPADLEAAKAAGWDVTGRQRPPRFTGTMALAQDGQSLELRTPQGTFRLAEDSQYIFPHQRWCQDSSGYVGREVTVRAWPEEVKGQRVLLVEHITQGDPEEDFFTGRIKMKEGRAYICNGPQGGEPYFQVHIKDQTIARELMDGFAMDLHGKVAREGAELTIDTPADVTYRIMARKGDAMEKVGDTFVYTAADTPRGPYASLLVGKLEITSPPRGRYWIEGRLVPRADFVKPGGVAERLGLDAAKYQHNVIFEFRSFGGDNETHKGKEKVFAKPGPASGTLLAYCKAVAVD